MNGNRRERGRKEEGGIWEEVSLRGMEISSDLHYPLQIKHSLCAVVSTFVVPAKMLCCPPESSSAFPNPTMV